jgi:hypothetical protein
MTNPISNIGMTRRNALALGATVAAGLAVVPVALAQGGKRKVVVWSEGTANVDPKSKVVYPNDVHTRLSPRACSQWKPRGGKSLKRP